MKPSISSLERGWPALSALIVEEELCINIRGRVEQCSACTDACPSDALSLSLDRIDVDDDKCTGCNSCLPSCPAGALRSRGFIPERFLQALQGREQVALHCRGSGDAGGGVVIPCHNVLDARLLAAARAGGVNKVALHGLKNCVDCKLGDAQGHIERVVDELRAWLGEAAPVLETDPQTPSEGQREYQDQPHMNRRSFLRLGGAQAVTRAADWTVPGLGEAEEDEEALPFFQADDYPQRPAQYQQVLVALAEQVPWQDEHSLPWTTRSVSEACSGCLSCGERCPTGALRAVETPEARQLDFDLSFCTDCGLCERICPESAIVTSMAEGRRAIHAGRKTLFYRRQKQCVQCGNPFDPVNGGRELCPVCSNEQDLDDEWLDMLSG